MGIIHMILDGIIFVVLVIFGVRAGLAKDYVLLVIYAILFGINMSLNWGYDEDE